MAGAAARYPEDGVHHDQMLGVTWAPKEVAEFTKPMFDVIPRLRFEIVNSFETDPSSSASWSCTAASRLEVPAVLGQR